MRPYFDAYAASEDLEKAFLTSRSGAFAIVYGARTKGEAINQALESCSRVGECSIYAVGNELWEDGPRRARRD